MFRVFGRSEGLLEVHNMTKLRFPIDITRHNKKKGGLRTLSIWPIFKHYVFLWYLPKRKAKLWGLRNLWSFGEPDFFYSKGGKQGWLGTFGFTTGGLTDIFIGKGAVREG